ncbi:hypothetical protein [Streptomyces sp. NBC_00035]|uniref:hypothetical protein n=1 Tax=Streptomyces sp. NBC_00035 TaxID=2903614 RepID=UPI003249AF72
MAHDGESDQQPAEPERGKAQPDGEPPDSGAASAQFDMQFVPSLPEGRAVFPAEREGKFVWLVAEGAMTRQCFQEMKGYLDHIVGSGMWQQKWDGDPPADGTT